MELLGSGSHGGTVRPREQYAQPGFHGVHLTCLWRCHGSGSGLSQLGKRQVVCLSEQTERSRDTCMSQLLHYDFGLCMYLCTVSLIFKCYYGSVPLHLHPLDSLFICLK